MMNNTTITEDYQQAGEPHMALQVSMGIIALVAFCSNGLLVVVFLRNKLLLKTPYNVLILSLAVTDMVTGEMAFFSVDSGYCCLCFSISDYCLCSQGFPTTI